LCDPCRLARQVKKILNARRFEWRSCCSRQNLRHDPAGDVGEAFVAAVVPLCVADFVSYQIAAYVGVPLRSLGAGQKSITFGTLCALDFQPRSPKRQLFAVNVNAPKRGQADHGQ
jgi:hypothetical protein